MNDNYRKSHLEKGVNYHATFSEIPYRAYMWREERRILDRIMTQYGRALETHLDFACGTGRILSHLSTHVESSTGLDVSQSMLEVAKENFPLARTICADVTRDNVLTDEQFDVITAFRFFPNAEQSLRDDVMSRLVTRIADSGILIFNNHINSNSSARRIARLKHGRKEHGMTIDEVHDLVSRHGLRIVHRYPLGIFPASEKTMVLPTAVLSVVDRTLAKISPLKSFALNTVFVCKLSDIN